MNIIVEATTAAKRLASAVARLWEPPDLTPEQRAKLDEMERDYEEFLRSRRADDQPSGTKKVQNKT